jgi:hypothetical protein
MGKAANHPNGLWAITAFYNPARYWTRRNNYQVFRKRLELPLLTVELSFDGQFELAPDDAEILILKADGDVMWQKERLLNIALDNLPPECQAVVWLDCDVIFQQVDWANQVCHLLEKFPLLQPYSVVHQLPRGISPEQWVAKPTGFARPSVAWLISQGMPVAECLGNPAAQYPAIRTPGHAWAARRDLLEQHRFYDACIIGGGDTVFACAAYGMAEALPKLHADNQLVFQHYLSWTGPFFESVQGQVSLIEGDLLHLWHGEVNDRRVRQRHHDMATFQFDPAMDIALTENDCWRWNSPKWTMHEYVANYFFARNEDGLVSNAAAV